MKNLLDRQFWAIVQANWTRDERTDLRAAVEAWMSARK